MAILKDLLVNGNSRVVGTMYGNLRGDVLPIVEKTYTGIIGTANSFAGANFFFGKIHPDNYTKHWRVKLRLSVLAPEAYTQYAIVEFGGYGSTFASYDSFVSRAGSIGVYYLELFRAQSAGITAGVGHMLGIALTSSTNPTTASDARTVKIEIFEEEGCTVILNDTAVAYTSMDGYSTTNYNTGTTNLTQMGIATQGQNATNSVGANTYDRRYCNATRFTVGTNGIFPYSLVMQKPDGTWESLTTSGGNGTAKPVNTNGFVPGMVYWFYYNATIASGGLTTNNYMYETYPGGDISYTFNCGSTLTANKSLYLVGQIRSGLFYVDSQMYSLGLPTAKDGKYYMYLGETTAAKNLSMNTVHPIYYYDNGIKLTSTGFSNGNVYINDDGMQFKGVSASGNALELSRKTATDSYGNYVYPELSMYSIADGDDLTELETINLNGANGNISALSFTESGTALTDKYAQYAFSGIGITAGATVLKVADTKDSIFTITAGSNINLSTGEAKGTTISAIDSSAYCATAAATAAKTATCTGYVLTANTYIQVIMASANSYNGAITLNINGKGAKPIYINGVASSSSNKTLPAGSYIVYYNGTYYDFRKDGILPGMIAKVSNTSVNIDNNGIKITDSDGGRVELIDAYSGENSGDYFGIMDFYNLGSNYEKTIELNGFGGAIAANSIVCNNNVCCDTLLIQRTVGNTTDTYAYLDLQGLRLYYDTNGVSQLGIDIISDGRISASNNISAASFTEDGTALSSKYAQIDAINYFTKSQYVQNTNPAFVAKNSTTTQQMNLVANGLWSSGYINSSNAFTSSERFIISRNSSGQTIVHSSSGTASTPVVCTNGTSGKQVSGLVCNTATQLGIYGEWGASTYKYMYVTVGTSDPRLKRNIADSTMNAIELLNKINLRQFDWIDTDKHWEVGYIAPELYELDRNLAIKPDDEDEAYWGVDQFYITGIHTKAIQELSAENTELKDKIQLLEERISRLEAQLN